MMHLSVVLFFSLFVLMIQLHALDSKEDKVDSFIKEGLKELKTKSYKCKSSKLSYLIWLKRVSLDQALFCCFSQLADKKVQYESRLHSWVILYEIFKEKKLTKKKKFALKQSMAIDKRKYINSDWYFLGPFQIGKPEFDGNPIEELDDVLLNRWNPKIFAFSEMLKNGIVKWTVLQSDSTGIINIQPQVNWNDLVMSLQSMAVTEWQGILVNELIITSDSTELLIQCLGVNLFFIDDIVLNGDIYRRSQYWYPIVLDAGIHVIKVPIRTTGHTSIQCQVKPRKKSVVVHDVRFVPDLIDGNWFSFYCALTASNLNVADSVEVTNVRIKHSNLEDGNFKCQLVDRTRLKPGQVSIILIKFSPFVDKISAKCKRKSYSITVTLRLSNGESQDVEVSLRCRSSDESFLFTFLDHDGSVQHAAAIRPLKPCALDSCPVLLTLHGTGVQASNQADSYKRMVKKKFLFGIEKVWVLAPTRFGAHNWEGPGELTSMQALKSLAALSMSTPWLAKVADDNAVVFAGHSMGGHGAWQVSIHNPDKALAIISAAGWLSKEDYGESNILYRHDISISHTDPAVKAIQESCIAENQADKHASNLKGIPVMIRVGADDKTVHPYYSRRMFRLLKEHNVNVTYKEFPGKEHWWWDTKSENDGGVTNDIQIRNFVTSAVEKHELQRKEACSTEGCEQSSSGGIYTSHYESRSSGVYTYVLYNPASFQGGRGVKVLLQKIPFRVSKYTIRIDQSHVDIRTSNIRSLELYETYIGKIGWKSKTVIIDGTTLEKFEGSPPWRFCITANMKFKPCELNILESKDIRGPMNYGPARRIAEQPFMIVYCDSGNVTETYLLKNSAVLLANFFLLTSDAHVNVYSSKEIEIEKMNEKNVIAIGTDFCLGNIGLQRLIVFEKQTIKIGNCVFHGENYSALYILPHVDNKLMMMLTGHTAQSIHRYVMSLSVPTIPPMTRSPFSNLIPDYVILSPEVLKKGPGGYACAGFWNNLWQYDVSSSSCSC